MVRADDDGLIVCAGQFADDVAYILWECKPQIPRATDTFVMRNGKILVQTFAAFGG